MMHRWSLLVATALLSWRAIEADVTLKNNRYSGLVIALDPAASLPELEQQVQIINSIKDVMTKASESVFEATNKRAYFSDVTIVLPDDWSVSTDRNASGRWESWKGSDLRVVTEGRHNSGPMTVPGGGCGVPGASLEVPLQYLTVSAVQQQYGDTGVVMTAEWLKYRYGVYEEHGYPGDSLYPHAYLGVVNKEAVPMVTGCTDPNALVGNWVDRNGSECEVMVDGRDPDPECRYIVQDTTSDYSIMFISHLNNVIHVCNNDTHDPAVPTRQNRLCGGKSVWEIMMLHDDFANGQNPPDPAISDTSPTFTVAKTTRPALFLLTDDNCGQKPDGGSECYGRAVYNKFKETLRTVLSQGTIPRVGLMKYINKRSALYQDKAFIPIEDLDLEDFLEFLPSIVFPQNVTSPEMALEEALDAIQKSDYVGEVNLLLIQMTWTDDDGTSYPAKLTEQITVTALLCGNAAFNPWLPTLAEDTNGKFFLNPEYDPMDASEALMTLVPGVNEVTLFHTEVSMDSENVTLYVQVDPSVGINTTFTVNFSNKSTGELVLTDPSGSDVLVLLPSTVVPDATDGQWKMLLKNPEGGTATVQVTSNPRSEEDQIEVVTWTSATSLGEVDLSAKGLVFYVSVNQGNKAVKDLDVTVKFFAGVAAPTSLEVKLQDDGFGDPDVQLHDGVYSAYVTDFASQAESRTEFFADVLIAPGTPPSPSLTSSLRQERPVYYTSRNLPRLLPQDPFAEEPCCGSEVPDAISVQMNRYMVGATSVVVTNGPGAGTYNPPPSQITNAVVTNVDQDDPQILQVSLKWIAPGKDLTTGTVTDYEVWYSDSKSDLVADFEACNLVQDDEYQGGKPIPVDYGSEQTTTVKLPKIAGGDTNYFIVIVGLDGNQKGPPSPLLGVAVAADIGITQSTATPESTSTSSLEPTESSTATPESTSTSSLASTESSTAQSTSTSSLEPTDSSTAQSTRTTDYIASSTTPRTTDPPNGFVGSAGFWALIGVSIGIVLIIIIIIVYCYFKSRSKRMGSSTQKLLLKNKKKQLKMSMRDTSYYDSVGISSNGVNEKIKMADTDAEKGLSTSTVPVSNGKDVTGEPPAKEVIVSSHHPSTQMPSGSMGVINEGLEEEDSNVYENADSSDEDEMVTSL